MVQPYQCQWHEWSVFMASVLRYSTWPLPRVQPLSLSRPSPSVVSVLRVFVRTRHLLFSMIFIVRFSLLLGVILSKTK